jgi:hypothetical protein
MVMIFSLVGADYSAPHSVFITKFGSAFMPDSLFVKAVWPCISSAFDDICRQFQAIASLSSA